MITLFDLHCISESTRCSRDYRYLLNRSGIWLFCRNESVTDFQPMNVNFGIIPPLGYKVKGKRNKNAELSRRALEILPGLRFR